MLSVFTASRFELLEGHLLDRLMAPGGDPFVADTVLVPSAAVRRRLSLAVADRHGVCAQVEFSFLAQWLWGRIGRVLAGVPLESPYDPGLLRWRLDACLQQGGWQDAHPRLAAWLAQADAPMRFELADRLAGLFDQYLTWRPEWLEAWSAGSLRATGSAGTAAGADERWQAELWRRLQSQLAVGRDGAGAHPARAFQERLGALPAGSAAVLGLPARVNVFCLPTLPPAYLDLLCALSRHVDIALYALNPCPAWWFDLASPREHARRVLQDDALHLEVGHRWLSAWGRQAQSTLGLLFDRDEAQDNHDLEEGANTPGQGGAASLLARLQEGVRELHDPAPGSLVAPSWPDHSVQVHVCHSLARELEVLHDRLLWWFAQPQAPRPDEVLVVVPDLEAAAPLIDQVFGTAPKGLRIPYAITGLPPVADNPLARALLALLDLAAGRMPLSAVLGVLQEPAVAERFDLDAAAQEALATALREADVRWGLDAAHRAACGQPPQARGTLRDGLERLWLAHALPAGLDSPWQGRVPASPVLPDPELLASLHAFLERLALLQSRLAHPMRPLQWQALLEWVLAQFTPEGRQWRAAHVAVAADVQAQYRELLTAGVDRPLDVALLSGALRERLAGRASGGVPTGAVTFAALPSLRLLPFRVVCALGLDDGVFPSAQRPLEFDLMALHPRRGDRNRGEEERNQFLDLLLAARDGLHLSCSGRSARDNAERPWSVLLAEFVDTLAPALCPPGAPAQLVQAMRARLVCQHPLQPFDEAYFLPGGGRLPRSHRHDLAAALRLRATTAAAAGTPGPALPPPDDDGGDDPGPDDAALAAAALAPFFASPLPVPDAGWRELELERLLRFLQHPGRALLRDRLGLRLAWQEAAWEDDEDFLPDRNAATALAQRLLPRLLADPQSDGGALQALARAGTDFPAGALGQLALQAELERLRAFARRVVLAGAAAPPPQHIVRLALDLPEGRWELSAPLPALQEGQQLGWDYADVKLRRELAIWLRHLWACAHAAPGAEPVTRWFLRDGTTGFRALPAGAARANLAMLVGLYAQGLRAPLAFFPNSAAALLEKGLPAAQASWYGSAGHRRGEGDDVAWRIVLRGVADPLGGEFGPLARAVLGPLQGARL